MICSINMKSAGNESDHAYEKESQSHSTFRFEYPVFLDDLCDVMRNFYFL